MPDNRGHLSDDERQKVVDHVNAFSTAVNDACLVCGNEDSRIGTILFIPAGGFVDGTGRYKYNGAVMPVVPVVCHNCGFVRHFHAERLGLSPPTVIDRDEQGG